MNDLIELGVPVVVFATYQVLLALVLRARGLRPLTYFGSVTQEKAAAWRRLRRWQFVATAGVLPFTVPMLLLIGMQRYMDWKYETYYVPRHHHYLWDAVILVVFVVGGVWSGLDLWKRIWHHAYDLAPKGTGISS
jgi:hypothetical protein